MPFVGVGPGTTIAAAAIADSNAALIAAGLFGIYVSVIAVAVLSDGVTPLPHAIVGEIVPL
jgi:hypothetical protein